MFFLQYAQNWCTKRAPAYEMALLRGDPHSPPRYRVNGPVSNMVEFAHAFGCAASNPMGRSLTAQRCDVW